jgi:hypothetical protein
LAEGIVGTEIKIWEISDEKISPVQETSLASQHVEDHLEDWITKDPGILGDEFLVIGRQWEVPGVGRLDLLCIDSDGRLALVELKRDTIARETVAQALDYASWLNEAEPNEILGRADKCLPSELSEEFKKRFGIEMPEILPEDHRMIIVATQVDPSAERIVKYLRKKHGVEIDIVLVKYARIAGEHEVLVRALLLPESARPLARPRPKQQAVEDWFREKISTFGEAAASLAAAADAVERIYDRLVKRYPHYFRDIREKGTVSLIPIDQWFKDWGPRVYWPDPKATYFRMFPEKRRQADSGGADETAAH